ncbi:MAG: DUF2100 domain-containing protein [Methanobacterium sp.]|nr:DUF2100 domain-containing protein [Methanobacterium sp.]
MDKLRYKQAQILLEKAIKSKKPQEILKKPHTGKINSQILREILNKLIDLEEFLYTSRPTHFLEQEEAQDFCDQIIIIRNKLDEILVDFGVIEQLNLEEEIKNLSGKYLILTTKSNFKKAMNKLSVDPQRVLVTGVPLQVEDMKIINPKIPDSALESIEKKISHVKNDIKRKKKQFEIEQVLVVVEKDKTGEILAKRAQEIYDAQIISVESIKDISPGEFLKLLSEF